MHPKFFVNTVLKSIGHIFAKLLSWMRFGTKMNASKFGVKKSKVG